MSLYYQKSAWFQLLLSKPTIEQKMELLIIEIQIKSQLAKELIESYGYFGSVNMDEVRDICTKLHNQKL